LLKFLFALFTRFSKEIIMTKKYHQKKVRDTL